MSDPMFLRNLISNSIYAEQLNSAQIQGQQAARERATRARLEAQKTENAAIQRLEEAAKADVQDKEGGQAHYQTQDHSEETAEDREGVNTSTEEGGVRHIDLTV